MKLKIDANGNAVLKDGKPVYIKDDGTEIEFDAAQAFGKISQLTGESKANRERAEAAEGKFAAFKDITDPAAALEAMRTVKNLKDKQLVDAGEVEKVKAEAIAAVEAKYKPIVEENSTLKNQLDNELIGGAFARSKMIADKLAIPADLVQARFGGNFKRVEGKVIAVDSAGNQIYSQKKPGDLADFEEALELLVDAYPHKASILKGSGSSGSGAAGGGQGAGGKKTYTRAQYDAMDPIAQRAAAKEASEGKAVLAD